MTTGTTSNFAKLTNESAMKLLYAVIEQRDTFNRQVSACTKNISQLEEALRDMTVERGTLLDELEACSVALPGPYYMDPPDGGSVSVGEQVARMAKDAARYRWALPILTGTDDDVAEKRAIGLAMQLALGLDGNVAIDAAIKAGV